MAKLSQRKRSPGVSPPESSAAPSAASAGIAARKKVKSAVARSGTARRQTLVEALIGLPRDARRSGRREPRQESFRQFRRPARHWLVRAVSARLPLPRQAPSLLLATPVAPRSAPR